MLVKVMLLRFWLILTFGRYGTLHSTKKDMICVPRHGAVSDRQAYGGDG